MAEPTSTAKPASIGRFLSRGDAFCILLFAVVGLQTHAEPISFWGVVRNSLPILVVWYLIAPFLRTYTYPTWRNLLYTWAIAVSAGVWLRFMVLGKPFGMGFFIFLGITLAFTLLFLLVWRFVALWILRRRGANL